MKTNNNFYSILILITAALLFGTNPTYRDHRMGIIDKYRGENKIMGFGVIKGELCTYSDYYLFSTTQLNGRLLSVGILNQVLVLEIEDE